MPKGWRTTVVPGVVVDSGSRHWHGSLLRARGRYPLPSSLLMTAIPARVAGVGEVVAACPRPDATVFAAALEAGVSRLFRIGGAHTIAALAYGTSTVPKVDKIVGPGSAYVAAAKARVSADCPIDFYAGPTEIVIVASGGKADWIAADLVAQAEHDPDARALADAQRAAGPRRRACRRHSAGPPHDRAAVAQAVWCSGRDSRPG